MELERRNHAIRFCPDDWLDALQVNLHYEAARARVEALQWQMGSRLLALGVNVIIEWGTWGRSERDALRVAARDMGARVELHYLAAGTDVLFERIRRRNREDPAITREAVLGWAEIFEAPTAEEFALYDPHTPT